MILVTNDDGPRGIGLTAVVGLLAGFDAIEVVVPDRDWSAFGRAHQGTAVRLASEPLGSAVPVVTRAATPARLVLAELTVGRPADEAITLCVAGINDGVNVGQDVTVSGTFCAALEAATLGCLGIAISAQKGFFEQEPTASGRTLAVLRQYIASQLLPLRGNAYVVNVNLPVVHCGGIEVTRISRQTVFPARVRADTSGGIEIIYCVPDITAVEADSDIAAVFHRGSISVSVADYVPVSIPDAISITSNASF
jgi:5'-nucleotidase